MAPRRQVPLLLLTGFLGSGKTSLLRGWLAAPAFANTIVLVNEIGEVGVDQQLLAPSAGDPLLLENGCVCCDAGGDLVAALEQLFYDRLHRKIPAFERVVIETTGLAAPSAVLEALRASEILRERYGAPLALATFDATQGLAQFARHPEVRDQVATAHALALTKTDVASEAEIEACLALLARERPETPVLASGSTPIGAQTILDLLAGPRRTVPGALRMSHTQAVSTAFAPVRGAVTEQALIAALRATIGNAGGAILRVKGVVDVSSRGPCSVQADAARIALEPLSVLPRECGLTIIAEEKPAADIAASLAAKLASRPLGMV